MEDMIDKSIREGTFEDAFTHDWHNNHLKYYSGHEILTGDWLIASVNQYHPEGDKIAAYICRAVNLHAELIEALEKALNYADLDYNWRNEADYDFARAILTKAKEQ